MKVRSLIKKMYQACINHDTVQEKKLWLKAIRKSLHHKKTHAIR